MDRLVGDFNNDRLLPTCEMLKILNNIYGNDPSTFSNIYTKKKHSNFKKRMFLADDACSIYVDKVSYELYSWCHPINNSRLKWYKIIEHGAPGMPEYNIDFSYKQIVLHSNTNLLLCYARHEKFDTIQRTVDFLNYAITRGLRNANDSMVDCVKKLSLDELSVFNQYSTIRQDQRINKLIDFGFSTVDYEVQEASGLETIRYAPLNIEFIQRSHKSLSGLTTWGQWTYKGRY